MSVQLQLPHPSSYTVVNLLRDRFTLCSFSVHKKTGGFGDKAFFVYLTYTGIFNSDTLLQQSVLAFYLQNILLHDFLNTQIRDSGTSQHQQTNKSALLQPLFSE